MQSVSTIANRLLFFAIIFLFITKISAQENSPFSRYGIGDLYPNQSTASRAMGGLSAAFADNQALNTNNPASYGDIKLPTFDLGLTIDARTLYDNAQNLKYNSTNFSPSYLAFGFPLNKKHGMGFAFGLKPISRINYSVLNTSTPVFNNQTDTLLSNYNGTGGLNQGYAGFGKRFSFDSGKMALNIGFNTGWNFGKKNISTIIDVLHDTTAYKQASSAVNTAMWGTFLNLGLQYDIRLDTVVNTLANTVTVYTLRFGGDYTFQQKLHANQGLVDETLYYDVNGAPIKIDSITTQTNILGNISLPSNYTAGLSLIKTVSTGFTSADKWIFGVEYDAAKWSEYTFYNQPDRTLNNWMARAGIQYSPDPLFGKSTWSRAIYRVGFFTGKNYINADGNGLKETAVTFGAGFHLKVRRSYDNEYSLFNTSFEIGKRGTGVNNITENYFKFSLGLSLSDIWFIKRKYE